MEITLRIYNDKNNYTYAADINKLKKLEYFSKMFGNNFKETNSKIIEIKYENPLALLTCIDELINDNYLHDKIIASNYLTIDDEHLFLKLNLQQRISYCETYGYTQNKINQILSMIPHNRITLEFNLPDIINKYLKAYYLCYFIKDNKLIIKSADANQHTILNSVEIGMPTFKYKCVICITHKYIINCSRNTVTIIDKYTQVIIKCITIYNYHQHRVSSEYIVIKDKHKFHIINLDNMISIDYNPITNQEDQFRLLYINSYYPKWDLFYHNNNNYIVVSCPDFVYLYNIEANISTKGTYDEKIILGTHCCCNFVYHDGKIYDILNGLSYRTKYFSKKDPSHFDINILATTDSIFSIRNGKTLNITHEYIITKNELYFVVSEVLIVIIDAELNIITSFLPNKYVDVFDDFKIF